jgi:heptosyltransferase-2
MHARAGEPLVVTGESRDTRPILLVPYMWIGDFVRCHSVVRVLNARFPDRPVDVLTNPLTAPLLDYMPGVRRGVISDLPRNRLALRRQRALAERLRREGYGTALVMPRTWKSALAPFLAGIPERIGFVGEVRFGLLNDARWGERALERMIDRCAALALPRGAALPPEWPEPRLLVPAEEAAAWRARRGLDDERPVVALCPGAVGPSKRWPDTAFGEVARRLAGQGFAVWVLGSPEEHPLAEAIIAGAGPHARNLTGRDLRDAVLALRSAQAAICNDSGLLHVAAAIGTPAIGIFGPTSPRLWAPLNPLAAVVETRTTVPCRPCHKPRCRFGHHRCMREIPAHDVLAAVHRALAEAGITGSGGVPHPLSRG